MSEKFKADFAFDDRVARHYNTQRAHPPEVAARIGSAIAAQAGGAGAHVVEIGVGTGRIAWPVAEAGCQVVGFDISGAMLAETYANPHSLAARARLTLLQADMHRIPLRDASMDAVLAVHVMHLAQDWQTMLREVARVLRSGGAFIEGNDWIDPQSVTGALRDELRAKVAALSPNFMPPAATAPRDAFMQQLGGGQVTELIAAEWTVWVAPNERLHAIESRADNESWILPPALFDTVVQHLRAYATERWADLDAPQAVTRRFLLKVTHGDWQSMS